MPVSCLAMLFRGAQILETRPPIGGNDIEPQQANENQIQRVPEKITPVLFGFQNFMFYILAEKKHIHQTP